MKYHLPGKVTYLQSVGHTAERAETLGIRNQGVCPPLLLKSQFLLLWSLIIVPRHQPISLQIQSCFVQTASMLGAPWSAQSQISTDTKVWKKTQISILLIPELLERFWSLHHQRTGSSKEISTPGRRYLHTEWKPFLLAFPVQIKATRGALQMQVTEKKDKFRIFYSCPLYHTGWDLLWWATFFKKIVFWLCQVKVAAYGI